MSPHGIPVDLLDRLVIIGTPQYVLEEHIAILKKQSQTPSFPWSFTSSFSPSAVRDKEADNGQNMCLLATCPSSAPATASSLHGHPILR